MSLMAMSISGAVLILVILAVRAGLKGRLPKRTFAVLWTVAIFRALFVERIHPDSECGS